MTKIKVMEIKMVTAEVTFMAMVDGEVEDGDGDED